MRLRFLKGSDADQVVTWRNANAEFFPPQSPWTVKSHLAWYSRYLADVNDWVYVVCLDDGTPVGTIGITKLEFGCYEIGRVLLGERDLAPKGIMSEALEEVIARHEADCYTLKVLTRNQRAVAFYAKHQFRITRLAGYCYYMTRTGDDS